MAKKLLFLNMSDTLLVDGRKAIDALKHKHPNIKGFWHPISGKSPIEEVPMVDFYNTFISGNHNAAFLGQRNNIREKCLQADKIFLSLHGPMKHVNYGIIKNPMNAANDVHVSDQQLANLLLSIFNNNQHGYNLTLVMCFGARSSRFRLDHQSLDQIDWTDSYAYKLFNRISPTRRVRMTARTGELSFNTITGISEVQTERSIQGTLDNEDISQEQALIDTRNWFDGKLAVFMKDAEISPFIIKMKIAEAEKTPSDKLVKLQQLRADHALPNNADRPRLLVYLDNQIRLVEASSRQIDPVQSKYGKMVYKYIHGMGNAIFAKYPNPICVHPKDDDGHSHAVKAKVLAMLSN